MRTSTFYDLIELFERSRHGIVGWELFRQVDDAARLIENGWLIETGQAEMFPAEFEDCQVPVALVPEDDGDAYRYRSPSTQRWHVVPRSQAALYKVDGGRFLHHTADLLGIPRNQRGGLRKPLLNDCLWSLGPVSLDQTSLPVWLIRGFAGRVAEVFRHFRDARWSDHGLILVCGPDVPDYFTPPRNYRLVSLRAILSEAHATAMVDWTQLERLLECVTTHGSVVAQMLLSLTTQHGIDCAGRFIRLTRQEKDVLIALIEHPDHEMSKEALRDAVGSQALDFKPAEVFKRHRAVYERFIRFRPDEGVYQLIVPDTDF